MSEEVKSVIAGFTGAQPAIQYVKPEFKYKDLPFVTEADVHNNTLMRTLWRACSTKRPHNSQAEARFVAWLVNRLPVSMIDGAGNVHVDMRRGPHNRTMFTSHTDSVHREGGPNRIRLDASDPRSVKWRADENYALGADDGAGIALMMHMIEADVAGYYIFFRGEECGGIGSQWMADNFNRFMKEIDHCVSLDRAGYSDVITHQAGGRCCSDAFAQALADQLTCWEEDVIYLPDSSGVFTDSANLTDYIGECTNLSVGYRGQHGDTECQDVTYLPILAAALVKVKWDELPVVRKAGEMEFMRRTVGINAGKMGRKRKGKGKHKDAHEAFTSMDGLSLTPVESNTCEEYLIGALVDASQGISYSAIRGIAAERLYPENAEQALKFIDPSRINNTLYGVYAEGLESGEFEYTQILEILAADLYKE